MRKRTHLFWCFVLTAMNLSLIWGNSLLPGQASGEISGDLLHFLKEMVPMLVNMGEFLLRKLGHFTEFAMLGVLLARICYLLEEEGFHAVSSPLLFGLLAAAADETIQVFVPDRGPSLIDVWIDVGGVLTGILLLLAGQAILRRLYWKGKRIK